ncbi:hypothetical protein AeRB84_007941 [Aphanomyces euteiches]|nr:hypothetical protein AeRB84_007941 [Aphanomyces euteiches]
MARAACTSYTNKQKRLIQEKKEREPHITLNQLASWAKLTFNLQKQPSRSTIHSILKGKTRTSPIVLANDDSLCVKHIKLEVKLMEWTMFAKSKGFFISQRIIRLQAAHFSRQVNAPLLLSNGWIYKFQKRHNLRLRTRSGEALSVTKEVIETGRAWLRQVLSEFSLRDTFNFDETALFYRALPKKSISAIANSGFKNDKSRITLGLGANADGSEKLEPIFIGKSLIPHCVRRAGGFESLNLQYYSSKKGWMTSRVFQDWLHRLEGRFKSENRRVLLLVDNVSSHKLGLVSLEFVKVVFLPPKTTAVLRPMDAGVIACFKNAYKNRQMELSLERFNNGSDVVSCFKFDVLEAMSMSKSVWDSLDASVIANSWRHTGILPN